MRGIGKELTGGVCILGSCMVSGADLNVTGGLNGKGDIGG